MKHHTFWSMSLIILLQGVLGAQQPIVVNTDLVTLRATVTDAKGNYELHALSLAKRNCLDTFPT